MSPTRFIPLCSCVMLAAIACPAMAQELDRATPLLETPEEYEAKAVQLGRISAYLGTDVRLEYDSNIYALPSNEIDDERLTISPWLNLKLSDDKFQLAAQARGVVRRYFKNETENSEGLNTSLGGVFRVSGSDSISANVGWTRLVEERGVPESLVGVGTSPRRYDQWQGDLGYTHSGARFTIGLKGSALKNNALAPVDAERDFNQYSGSARLGYRVSGMMNVFGEGFIAVRDFRLAVDASGVNRNSKTYGARAGVSFEPGGLIRGEAAVGVFRFNPEDARFDSRTGLSVSAGLVYTPSPRWAFTLDGFRGDVATVRNGAQARTDTRFRAGVQNEVYHNLRWQASVIYRRSNFIGTAQHERTIAGVAEIEYLVNRNMSFALTGRIASRESTRAFDDFDRRIVGAEIRLQY
ncbi:hypothetical protein BV98_001659 [Sphingobium herbicidovorans NBRC 16415]|uniref:Outer membrane beta-barrel protein n=2 Tax=Sphingobium herbicidovorans TaxID=76947 RepID=A0A086PAN7_SPHHM|nr:hypothetical protein BV98_001659 [Sphingobium herbicidovorans NBRC 16415]